MPARRRCARYVLLGALVLAAGCVNSHGSLPTGTRITPEVFRYATIIKAPVDGSAGGWRAVCIKASTGQRLAHPQGAHLDTHVRCGLEFGSPIVNRQHGYIPLRMAQEISAEVANEVAYRVLSRERGITATTCRKLIAGMNIRLDEEIRGSTVTACGVTNWSQRVPVVYWPAHDE